MKRYAKYIMLMTATALTACSDNEADTPDDKSNPDPIGTVSTTCTTRITETLISEACT